MARNVEHASFFSYSVQRPYPLRWFTPVAVVGGIILTALISFANFVAYGYELTTVYSSDPGTIDQDLWFKDWPGWLRRNINATCAPADLPVNSQFFTNQSALAYTLTSITIAEDGVSSSSPSLPYLNNVLKHCELLNITMDFSCSLLQNPLQLSRQTCSIDVRAEPTCTIDGPNGVATLYLSSHYNPRPAYVSPGSSSFIQNSTSRASLWWADELLLTYWYDTDIALFKALNPYNSSAFSAYNSGKGIVQGTANFWRNETQQNIMELDFFGVWYSFMGLKDSKVYAGIDVVKKIIDGTSSLAVNSPPIWRQADGLAKSMYSALMTDLGQTKAPPSSNIVADPKILQTFSEKFPLLHNSEAWRIEGVPPLNLVIPDGTYDDLRASVGTGPLEITPSVISTNYLCSVPRMKSTGSIFISILLADLVLLNAAWIVYCLIVGRFFLRSPTANYCEGCLKTMNEFQPLRAVSKSNATSVPNLHALDLDRALSTNAYEPVQMRGRGSSESLMDSRAERP